MRTVDEIRADKVAALKRLDFEAAADFYQEEQQTKVTIYQCPQCAKLKEFVAEVAKGQQGELKGDFIARIMAMAKKLL